MAKVEVMLYIAFFVLLIVAVWIGAGFTVWLASVPFSREKRGRLIDVISVKHRAAGHRRAREFGISVDELKRKYPFYRDTTKDIHAILFVLIVLNGFFALRFVLYTLWEWNGINLREHA